MRRSIQKVSSFLLGFACVTIMAHGTCLGNGGVIYRAIYSPFGEVLSETTSRPGNAIYTFTGQERDPSLGMLDYGERFYHPGIGRFASLDPVDHPGESPYAYANGNPLRYVDPTGGDSKEANKEGQKVKFVLSKSAIQAVRKIGTAWMVEQDLSLAMKQGHPMSNALESGRAIKTASGIVGVAIDVGVGVAQGKSLPKAGLETAVSNLHPMGGFMLSLGTAVKETLDQWNEWRKRDEDGYIYVDEYGGTLFYIVHLGKKVTRENCKEIIEEWKESNLEAPARDGGQLEGKANDTGGTDVSSSVEKAPQDNQGKPAKSTSPPKRPEQDLE